MVDLYFTTNEFVGTIEVRKSKDAHFKADLTAVAYESNMLLFASMVGPATSIDAIRASISMGREVEVYSRYIKAYGESVKAKGSKFRYVPQRLVPTRRDHLIVINDVLTEDVLGSHISYVMAPVNQPAQPTVSERIRELFPIALLPEWDQRLYDWAVREKRIVAVTQRGTNIQKIIFDNPHDEDRPPVWEPFVLQQVKLGRWRWDDLPDMV